MQAWGNLWHGLPAREIGIHRQDADATKKFSQKRGSWGEVAQAGINIAPLALTHTAALRRPAGARTLRGMIR
jgi:hypothetical protein